MHWSSTSSYQRRGCRQWGPESRQRVRGVAAGRIGGDLTGEKANEKMPILQNDWIEEALDHNGKNNKNHHHTKNKNY